MKKKRYALLLVLLLSLSTFAQDSKPYLGIYRASGNAHLLLAENNTFYIIGYATFIRGSWHMENNKIILNPLNPKHFFELYGRYNPNIKKGYKIKFTGFEQEQTFIGKDNSDAMQRVFNKSPNCFETKYLHLFNEKITTISFVDLVSEEVRDYNPRNTYSFPLNKNNDFIAVYNDPRRYNYEMIFTIIKTAKGIILDGPHEFEKMKPDEKLKKEMKEITAMGKKIKVKDILYFNPSYRLFDESSMKMSLNYSFNQSKNAYVSKLNYQKDEELYPEKKQDAYHSTGILYKYDKIPASKIESKSLKIIEKSLFTAKCDSSE
jgi:hypothetical protein